MKDETIPAGPAAPARRVRWKRFAVFAGALALLVAAALTVLHFRFVEEVETYVPAPHKPAPVVADLVSAGVRTAERLLESGASWRTRCIFPGGLIVEARVFRDRERTAWTFTQSVNRRAPEIICRIVATGDEWRVIEGDAHSIYRPYEAVLHLPGGYAALSLSELRCVLEEEQMTSARYQGTRGNVAMYRQPVPPEQRANLANWIPQLTTSLSQVGDAAKRRQMEAQLRSMKKLLDHGMPMEADATNGVIVMFAIGNVTVVTDEFEWLEKLPETAFALPAGVDWEDHTQPWPAAELADTIMVAHDPIYREIDGQPNADGYLLNLRTAELRRLPHAGTVSQPGCFLPGRRAAILSSGEPGGALELVKLDFETGETTSLEPNPPLAGILVAGELSPDGAEVLVTEILGQERVLDHQLLRVNHATGELRRIGAPGNWGGPMAWLPDGSGVIMKRFEPVADRAGTEPTTLCRMDLAGTVTDLRPGDTGLVLRKARKILFLVQETRLWHTCALDGSGVELYADGLPNHGAPAVSPDETKVLFVRYEKGKLPQLLLFNWGETEGRPVIKTDAFLSNPVWR